MLLPSWTAWKCETGDRQGEGADLCNLGLCHQRLGDYRQAIELLTQALAIAREIGDRYIEACSLDYLGRVRLASGDVRQAVTLLEQAVRVADAIHDIEPAVARSDLARAHLQSNNPAAALTATAEARELRYPTEEPTLRLLEGLALLEMNRFDEGVRAFDDALRAADALLALAERNLAALGTRGTGPERTRRRHRRSDKGEGGGG